MAFASAGIPGAAEGALFGIKRILGLDRSYVLDVTGPFIPAPVPGSDLLVKDKHMVELGSKRQQEYDHCQQCRETTGQMDECCENIGFHILTSIHGLFGLPYENRILLTSPDVQRISPTLDPEFSQSLSFTSQNPHIPDPGGVSAPSHQNPLYAL